MTFQKYLIAGAVSAFGLMAAMPANASYMSNCNTLISAWNECRATGELCTTQFDRIIKECKCHSLRQGEWKLVTAAVGKDGVCAPPEDPPWPPWDGAPDPSPPPNPDPPGDDKRKDDDHKKKKTGKAKPVTTYGGERGPGETSPNKRTDD